MPSDWPSASRSPSPMPGGVSERGQQRRASSSKASACRRCCAAISTFIGSRQTMMVDDLVDVLKRRGLDRVCYFHVDHFEPWSFAIDQDSARAVDRFAEMARGSRYARKLSLFYSVFVPYHLETPESGAVDGDRIPGDSIVFGRRTPEHEALAPAARRP